MKKIYFLIVGILMTGCFKEAEVSPKKWVDHVARSKKSFKKKLSVPSSQQHLYVEFDSDQTFYLIKNAEDIELSKEKVKETLSSYKIDFSEKTLEILSQNKKYKEDEEVSFDHKYKIKFYIYDFPEGKKARVFLYNLNMKDLKKKRERSFFKYSSKYKLSGRYEPLAVPLKVLFTRSDDSAKEFLRIGKLTIEDKGELHIYGEPSSKETRAMLMFRDNTNGKSTYGAGRYLVTDFKKPLDSIQKGEVFELDFNFATNPPCAKSKAFHCPLAQDVLNLEIKAGEKK